jgi:Brp/Blh family beta-carotene 15,15'-monooxygenase
MRRLTFGQAGALALLMALHLNGASLSGTVPTVSACVAILLFGLPHGAFDLEIIRRERGTGRAGIAALLMMYIALAAAMAAMWRSAPVAALAIFLVVAVVHFAEDWPEMGSTFLAQGMAIALLTAPALLHLGQLEQLFVALSGHRDGAVVANIILLVAPVGIVVGSVALLTLWRTGARDQAVAGALALAAMLVLPPVVGFALFFCLYHSPRHLGAAMSRVAGSPGARRIALLATLAALGITAALFVEEVRADVPARLVAASFMTLSLLTVPHMIVPAVVARLAALRAGGQGRHGSIPT